MDGNSIASSSLMTPAVDPSEVAALKKKQTVIDNKMDDIQSFVAEMANTVLKPVMDLFF